ncbi:unnamed protein product [Caenorhabditis auriculariae]|uniref:Uncharacterized protein n=1 Tax=Caenorhabditis auriculariae TaxID=2777116 RepID=A0A8S1HLD6_9PELO|nr:unnamed protein product [Caenorhabditis auriculariae]
MLVIIWLLINFCACQYLEKPLSSAVVQDVQEVWPDKSVERATLPPSIMSGYISDSMIRSFANYIFSLLDGTGTVIKKKRVKATSSTFEDYSDAVLKMEPETVFVPELNIRRKPSKGPLVFGEVFRKTKSWGVSRKKLPRGMSHAKPMPPPLSRVRIRGTNNAPHDFLISSLLLGKLTENTVN